MTIDTPRTKITTGSGFMIRALARIIDMIFIYAIGMVGGVLGVIIIAILQRIGHIEAGWDQKLQGNGIDYIIFGLIGTVCYHTICEGVHGSSLGKQLCRIRVIQMNGKPCNMRAAFIRTLAWFGDSVFLGLIGYTSMSKSPLNRRYGDVWAKTLVVRSKDIASIHPRGAIHFVLGLFLRSTTIVMFNAIAVVVRGS